MKTQSIKTRIIGLTIIIFEITISKFDHLYQMRYNSFSIMEYFSLLKVEHFSRNNAKRINIFNSPSYND